jgi:hypothetical protein
MAEGGRIELSGPVRDRWFSKPVRLANLRRPSIEMSRALKVGSERVELSRAHTSRQVLSLLRLPFRHDPIVRACPHGWSRPARRTCCSVVKEDLRPEGRRLWARKPLNAKTPSGGAGGGFLNSFGLVDLLAQLPPPACSYSHDDRLVVVLVSRDVVNKRFIVLSSSAGRGCRP